MWRQIKKYIRPREEVRKISAEEWKNHFAGVFEVERGRNHPEEWSVHPDLSTEDEILDKEITSDEVGRAIRKLKNRKSPGADGLGGEFIKSIGRYIKGLLAFVFTKILLLGRYPIDWTLAVVVPIYKGKGNKKDPSSYRPVSLLPTLGKVFTSILNDRLTTWMDLKGVLEEAQAGYRKGYSTLDHAFVLDTVITGS